MAWERFYHTSWKMFITSYFLLFQIDVISRDTLLDSGLKKALAIVCGVKRFYQYLFGRKFILTTDHKPLLRLFGHQKSIPHMASSRLQRWCLTMSTYNYELCYRAGKSNGNADALSRLPLPDRPDSVPIS